MTLILERATSAAHSPSSALEMIAAECQVLSGDAFRYAGTDVARPLEMAAAGDGWLSAVMCATLYRHYYLGIPEPASDLGDRRPAFVREDPELGRLLRSANACTRHWEPGWEVAVAAGADGAVVVRDGLRLHVTGDEMCPAGAAVGAQVQVGFPADRPFASPGFYLTVSSLGPVDPVEGLVRWYFAVRPWCAPALFGALTAALDGLGSRFVMKTLNDPTAYPRPDATVLYVRRVDVPQVAPVVRDVALRGGIELGDRVPLFTRRLSSGLAIADDPPFQGRPMSFGEHRCSLIVRGLVAAGPGSTPAERRVAVRESLITEGIDPERPHLNKGTDEFDLEEFSWSS